ncbi:protein kinase [Bifidobacterium saguini DSM 23967]|uniref:non-specific serine/threonine protein kinase n=2 Tax=Bifidobacterium saguini TaxID=762210 RepID=A0A087DEM6_9BIFI|nr:serine/threonine-protein kinase [Bifidobacterium saguini]KFI93976.1 protein kinase [Bifidobacterium saguini DSM 23967]QTB90291.1 serine/threonine protein kinase [Bifidobacterium saguini]
MSVTIAPPQLPGYDFVQRLGSGAAATVFLYNQRMPQRPVAVKVSNATLEPHAAAAFSREANFMAKLSSNPYILSVYDAGVSANGHGFMVLEYASGGSYNSAMKSRSMSCEQVLDLGIKLAGALYTAHRNNIIHHDIKPSNILITTQGLPVLSDFGISTDVYDRAATGFSLPWAPPEVLEHRTNGSETADIYSLAATLYALLAGCSPYQHEYHPHTSSELAELIINQPLPRIGRPDVPATVESVLGKALSKNPDQRYYSALEFARAMQRVQHEEYGQITPLVAEGIPPYPKDAKRRIKNATNTHTPNRTHRTWLKPAIITGAALAAIAVVTSTFVFVVLPHMDSASTATPTHVDASGVDDSTRNRSNTDDSAAATLNNQIPSPENLSGQYSQDGSSVTFTWTNPDPQNGDSYAWSFIQSTAADQSVQTTTTTDTSITVDAQDGAQTCIQVSIVRSNRQMSTSPAVACTAKPESD